MGWLGGLLLVLPGLMCLESSCGLARLWSQLGPANQEVFPLQGGRIELPFMLMTVIQEQKPRRTALSLCLNHTCPIGQSELCGQAQGQRGMRQYQCVDARDVIHWVFCMKIYHWQILS